MLDKKWLKKAETYLKARGVKPLTREQLIECVGRDYCERWGAASDRAVENKNDHGAVADMFDIIAEESERFWGLSYQARLRSLAFLAADLERRPADTFLDAGCGCGIDLLFFARYFPKGQYLGYDLSPKMVAKARKRMASNGIENVTILEPMPHEKVAKTVTPGTIEVVLAQSPDFNLADNLGHALFKLLAPGGRVYLFVYENPSALLMFLEVLSHCGGRKPRIYNLDLLQPVTRLDKDALSNAYWAIVYESSE